MNKEAKELSECLDVMPKDIKELQKMAYNVILDSNQQLLERLSEKVEEELKLFYVTEPEVIAYKKGLIKVKTLIQEEKANL